MKKWARLMTRPYLIWMMIFILLPLLLILVYSFTAGEINDFRNLTFSLDNLRKFFQPIYLNVTWLSLKLAFIATVLCLLLGYPLAVIIANAQRSRYVMLMLLVAPMWMNFLLRTYAWMTLLGQNGLINKALSFLGLPTLNLLYNNGAILLGMVYNFIPFMILPIYTVLSKIDQQVIEAAEDLGANRFKVFTKIIFPLSLPGVLSGITMVFMPAVSTFVISRLLGGNKTMLIGNLIEKQFIEQNNWHFGSAISLVMIVIILITMAVISRFDQFDPEDNLW